MTKIVIQSTQLCLFWLNAQNFMGDLEGEKYNLCKWRCRPSGDGERDTSSVMDMGSK